jgi:hypothetical protein
MSCHSYQVSNNGTTQQNRLISFESSVPDQTRDWLTRAIGLVTSALAFQPDRIVLECFGFYCS